MEIGKFNSLIILRHTSVGIFLGEKDETLERNEILLPNKYVPMIFKLGDILSVFVYLDHEERLVATTLQPLIEKNKFAYLKVNYINEFGAFLNWGLEKDLFCPFREQVIPMREGSSYFVYCYLDQQSNRLAASSRINKFLKNDTLEVQEGDTVDLIVSHMSDIGVNVVINEKHRGVLYHDEIFVDLRVGDRTQGIIKKIREDNKIDVTLQKVGFVHIEDSARIILDAIKKYDGLLRLNDDSTPEEIKAELKMSKKTFKRAVGTLLKQQLIKITDKGIHMV